MEFYSSIAVLRASACRTPRSKHGGIGLTRRGEIGKQKERARDACVHSGTTTQNSRGGKRIPYS